VIRLSGRLRSALIIGGQGIRARKTRTALSMISLFLGVLAVVVVQAGAEIARQAAIADLALKVGKDGTMQMFFQPSEKAATAVLDGLRGRGDALAVMSTQATIGEPNVQPVNPGGGPFRDSGGEPSWASEGGGGFTLVCDDQGSCRPVPLGPETGGPPGAAIALDLRVMTGDVRQFIPYQMEAGRWLDFTGAPALAPRIVVNREAAKGLARHRVPAQLHVPGTTADPTPQIIGVVEDGNTQPVAYVWADDMFNWLPAPVAQAEWVQQSVQIMLAPSAQETERLLRSRLIAAGVPTQGVHTEVINARKSIAKTLALVRLVFLGLAGLVLLIGVAGILNVGLATVGERVEEFALRRAVGTPRSLLAGIVLAETLLTGLFTAALAIGLSAAALRVGVPLLHRPEPFLQHVVFPWQAGVAGVVAGLIAGLLGGLIPALRAARIPIATVMRA
jgi:putative ABC transport system permease protein